MKTTVEIENELLRAAKRAALDRGLTLRQLIEPALRRELSAPRNKPLKLVTVPGRVPEWVANREKCGSGLIARMRASDCARHQPA